MKCEEVRTVQIPQSPVCPQTWMAALCSEGNGVGSSLGPRSSVHVGALCVLIPGLGNGCSLGTWEGEGECDGLSQRPACSGNWLFPKMEERFEDCLQPS